MKIRQGFVSNSSSSSFVCILRKDEADKVLLNMTPIQRAMFDYVFGPSKIELGIEVYEMNGAAGDNYYFYEDFDCPEELREEFETKYDYSDSELWEEVDNFIGQIPKDARYSCYPDAG